MSTALKLGSLAKQRLFAIIHMFGRQSRVTAGDLIKFDHALPLECGQKLLFNKCLVLGGQDFSLIGRPLVDKELFRIEGTVVEKTMTDHKCDFRHTPRNGGLRKYYYHADPRTVVRINSIELKNLPDC